MAVDPKKFASILVNATTARREQASRLKADNAQRSHSVTLLNPEEVAGDYDGSRLLYTTLHGTPSQLTQEDLRQFQANIRNLKKRFKGGVSARALLDKSLQIDRDRANREIHMGIPVSSKAGVIHFTTNSGPNSDVRRHHVYVELLNYSAIAASPKPAAKLAKEMLEGAARWDCDCKRHRFWYRYLLTTLKANFGVSETAFPKVRNPSLRGTCCKHVVRVAHMMLNSGVVRTYAQKMIERGRADVTGKRVDESKDDIKKLAAVAAAESKRKRTIIDPKTPAQKRMATMAKKAKEAMKQAAVELARKNKPAQPKTAGSSRKIEQHARQLLALGAITQAQFNQITGAGK